MKNIGLAVFGLFLAFIVMFAGMWISYHNEEVSLRNAIIAKQVDNTNEFDNMWKKIAQVAQVSEKQKEAFKEIFTSYVSGRGANSSDGQMMTWVKENVPTPDLSIYNEVLNIIVASRNSFTTRQKELLDMKRAHDNLIDQLPSGFFLRIMGRDKINVTIVTSSKTDKVFETGKDNDINVF